MIIADDIDETVFMKGLFKMRVGNPKFLNTEKKVPYNIRLPQRLIEKYNSYSELTGNTTTNIITNVLNDFIDDKVVMNDYLDNTGGLTVKIPYAVYQKHRLTTDDGAFAFNLLSYNKSKEYHYYIGDEMYSDTYFAELFEVKKIPNNLDISNGESYNVNDKNLIVDPNAIHSGIELFVYKDVVKSMSADAILSNYCEYDSFVNCLYCLYFEIKVNDVKVYIIDYLKAINLLSASGNDSYKDLIIACVTELKKVDEIADELYNEICNGEVEILEKYDFDKDSYEKEFDAFKKNLKAEYDLKFESTVYDIANKYNSGNIILFGTDIFSRIAVKNVMLKPDLIDDLIDEKINDRIERLETENAELKSRLEKIDKINEMIIGDIDDEKLKELHKLL